MIDSCETYIYSKSVELRDPHLYSEVLRKPCKKDIDSTDPRQKKRESLYLRLVLLQKFLRFQSTRAKHNASFSNDVCRRPKPNDAAKVQRKIRTAKQFG